MHAKCLRSVESVRDYFRDYRAKKKGDKQVSLPAKLRTAISSLSYCIDNGCVHRERAVGVQGGGAALCLLRCELVQQLRIVNYSTFKS